MTDIKSDYFGGPTSDGKIIRKMMSDLSLRLASIKDHMQVLLTSITLHAVKHGDVTLANEFVKELTTKGGEFDKGWRLNAIRQWLVDCGPFRYDEETKTIGYSKAKCTKLKEEYETSGEVKFASRLRAIDWTAKKPETPFEGYSFTQKILTAIKKARKDKADETKAPLLRDVSDDVLDKFEAFAKQFEVTAKGTT